MSRIARLTADCGGVGDRGFYIEEPDIPQGITCRDWRRGREDARPQRAGWPPALFRRPALRGATS
jgi:hypothetical protein